jgi:hypothetical protein
MLFFFNIQTFGEFESDVVVVRRVDISVNQSR